MNEYIYKSFSDKFESYKQREELVNNIRYFNDIDFAKMDPTNIGQHLELSYVKNIYDNSERNPYLQNMNPNVNIHIVNLIILRKNLIILVIQLV
jgi:hypothetical protein